MRILFLVCLLAAACDSGPSVAPCPSTRCSCTGGTCTCSGDCTWRGPGNLVCDGVTTDCSGTCGGDACNLTCDAAMSCAFDSGRNSNVTCTNSSCTLTVGAGSTVACSGATCDVTCTGACSLTCNGGSCKLKCAGDATPKTVTGSAQCS